MSRKTTAEKFQNEEYAISVTGRHVLVTDAMEQYAIEKISKIERFMDRLIEVNIVMDIQKLEHRIDITMKAGNLIIRASGASDNMYASIDKAVDRLETQLRRYKGRLREHQLREHPSIDMNVNIVSRNEALIDEVNDEIASANTAALVDSYTPHRIVSRESRPLKTLNYKEALMKVELSGDAFLVFRSEEDQKLKVIYRRNDGNFGILEPER